MGDGGRSGGGYGRQSEQGGGRGGQRNGAGGDEQGGRGGRGGAGFGRRSPGFGRRKVCRYCADKNAKVDYKDYTQLKYFLTERGKIIPRRISGNCATHQREVAVAIKRSRQIALLPYSIVNG
jgi:small subunit ribosomal protein S18